MGKNEKKSAKVGETPPTHAHLRQWQIIKKNSCSNEQNTKELKD